MKPRDIHTASQANSGERNAAFIVMLVLVFFTASFYRDFSHIAASLGGGSLYVTELALALIGVFLALEVLRTRVLFWRLGPCAPFALLFVAWGAVCLFRGRAHPILSMREFATNYYAIFYLLVALLVTSSSRLSVLAGSIFAGTIVAFAVVCLRIVAGEGSLTSTGALRFHAPVVIGGAAAFFGLLAAPAATRGRRVLYSIGACLAALVIVVATQHRSAAVALAAACIAWLGWFHTGRGKGSIGSRGSLVLIIVLASVVVASVPTLATQTLERLKSIGPSGEEVNATWRYFVWGLLVTRVMASPIVGFGFGDNFPAFDFAGVEYGVDPMIPFGVHNSFIFVLYKEGLVGLLLLFGFVGSLVYRCSVAQRRSISLGKRPWVASAALASFVFVVAFAQFNVVLEGPYMGMFFWLYAGLAEAALLFAENGEEG